MQISPEKRPGAARLVGRRLEGILKTASGIENGNPFQNCRFFIDGRALEAEAEGGTSGEDAQEEAFETLNDAAPDIPYRALSDERAEENAASPFERTTEVNDEDERDPNGSTSTLAFDASESGDFVLAEDVASGEKNDADDDFELSATADVRRVGGAAVAFGSGNGESESDFCAPTAVETENWEAERENEPSTAPAENDDEADDAEDVEATSLDKYKRSRFVSIDERELDALPQKSEKRSIWRTAQILATVFVLGGLIAFLGRVFQAPSADRLFERIESELNVPDDELSGALRRAEKDLRQMVELYPNDSRSETASEWLERLEVESTENRLERRLARRRRSAPSGPIERAYLDALRVAEENPDEGVVKLTAFIELLASEPQEEKGARTLENDEPNEAASTQNSENDEPNEAALTQAFVAVATRKLERLLEEREKARAEDLAFIAERWSAAVALESTNRAEAEKIRSALLELYGERAWAAEALREVEAVDWSVDSANDAAQR